MKKKVIFALAVLVVLTTLVAGNIPGVQAQTYTTEAVYETFLVKHYIATDSFTQIPWTELIEQTPIQADPTFMAGVAWYGLSGSWWDPTWNRVDRGGHCFNTADLAGKTITGAEIRSKVTHQSYYFDSHPEGNRTIALVQWSGISGNRDQFTNTLSTQVVTDIGQDLVWTVPIGVVNTSGETCLGLMFEDDILGTPPSYVSDGNYLSINFLGPQLVVMYEDEAPTTAPETFPIHTWMRSTGSGSGPWDWITHNAVVNHSRSTWDLFLDGSGESWFAPNILSVCVDTSQIPDDASIDTTTMNMYYRGKYEWATGYVSATFAIYTTDWDCESLPETYLEMWEGQTPLAEVPVTWSANWYGWVEIPLPTDHISKTGSTNFMVSIKELWTQEVPPSSGPYRFWWTRPGLGFDPHLQISYAQDPLSPDVHVTVLDTEGNPQAGLPVYAFDGSTYTGFNKITDANGQVTFTLPEGDYRFRSDKNGTQFWSGSANHCTVLGCSEASVTVTVPITVTVLDTNGDPQAGLPVYAFNGSTYTGFNKNTGANGQAIFTLPEGDYRFRSDKNGTQFWSGTANHCTLPDCTEASVTVTVPVVVTVLDTNGDPQAGLAVYAFNSSTYTGYNKTTYANGQATFTLPEGDYRFRSDKNGTQFWSGTANHCTLPGCTEANVTVTVPVVVTVLDTDGNPQSGLPVYAFNGSTYTGYNKTTNADGQATFTLPEGDYRFRSDKNGTQFWSGTVNHCTLPGCTEASVTVTVPVVVTVLDTDSDPQAGLPIYVFDGSTYTGYNKTTDANGQAIFTLPEGDYRFRSDKNGAQFWSGIVNHCTLPGCTEASVTVTVPVVVIVLDTDDNPQAGLPIYAFNGSTYTGYNKTTDANGQAIFTLPEGSYRFRSDKNGTQFWSGTANHCTLPGCTEASVTVTVPVVVTVLDTSGDPQVGLPIYAFDGSTYTGFNKTTDANGQAIFMLPEGSYRFRVDHDGQQTWSASINHCSVPGYHGQCDRI